MASDKAKMAADLAKDSAMKGVDMAKDSASMAKEGAMKGVDMASDRAKMAADMAMDGVESAKDKSGVNAMADKAGVSKVRHTSVPLLGLVRALCGNLKVPFLSLPSWVGSQPVNKVTPKLPQQQQQQQRARLIIACRLTGLWRRFRRGQSR